MRTTLLLALMVLMGCGFLPWDKADTAPKKDPGQYFTNPMKTVLSVVKRLETGGGCYEKHTWFEVADTPNAKFSRIGVNWGVPGDSLYVVLKNVEWDALQLIREQQLVKKEAKEPKEWWEK